MLRLFYYYDHVLVFSCSGIALTQHETGVTALAELHHHWILAEWLIFSLYSS
jgi:hypothetical protein